MTRDIFEKHMIQFDMYELVVRRANLVHEERRVQIQGEMKNEKTD